MSRRWTPHLELLETRTQPSAISFVFQNNSGFPNQAIHIALYGKDPNFVSTNNPNGFVYVDEDGTSHSLSDSSLPYLAETTLAFAINDTQTTITVTSADGFPAAYPPGAPTTPIIIGSEVMLVTGIVPQTRGLTWTVMRGQFGTTNAAHAAAAVVKWDVQHVPNFNLAMLSGANPTLNLTTATTLHSGRLLIAYESKVFATIATDQVGGIAGGKVQGVGPPAAGSISDLNAKSYYDFFELDLAGGNINGNTSQVDQFGIPYTLSFTPGDPNNPNGVGVNATRHDVITGFKTFVAGTDFEDCWKLAPMGDHGIFRILSPASILELHPNNPLHTHFTSYVDQFYQQYSQAGQFVDLTVSSVPGVPTRTYRGSVTLNGGNYVFQFQQHGTDPGGGSDPNLYNVYYPFFTSNAASYAKHTPLLTPAAPPSWLTGTTSSPSEMIFAAHDVFADNLSQFPSDATASTILGNIENQLVAELNRGVALNTPSTWGDHTTFYQTAPYNRYAHFFHNNGISIDAKAYGFPYDDQGGQSSDFAVNNLTQLTLTLGPWGFSTKKELFGVSGINGQVQVLAADTNTLWTQFSPYGGGYQHGVTLAWGDIDADGYPDLITSAASGNPHVKVFSGRDLENGEFDPANPSASVLASWLAFGEGFNVGANIATGDVDGDGYADIAAAANIGNPHVRLFRGQDVAHGTFNPTGGSLLAEWFAYDLQHNIGGSVAIGDMNGDGWADVITGAADGNPHVKVYDGETIAGGSFDPDLSLVWQAFTYSLDIGLGAFVATGDVNGDGQFELIAGASGGNPSVRVYDGPSGTLLNEFFAFALDQNIGVTVGAATIGSEAAVFVAPTTGAPQYRAFEPVSGTMLFEGVPAGFPTGGMYVAA